MICGMILAHGDPDVGVQPGPGKPVDTERLTEGHMQRMLLGLAAAVGLAAPAAAHHSFAAYYFEDESVTIEGEVVEFAYVAPHAWVYVMAPDSSGQMRRYAAEWSNPTRLQRDGIRPDTLKTGDRVIITGSPGRKASEFKIHLKRIERPADGWRWLGRGSRQRRS